jgi:RND family efflux transporter MFP subunit
LIRKFVQVFSIILLLLHGAQANEQTSSEKLDDTLSGLDCVMEPSIIADIGSASPGVVEKIYPHRSDLVKKGETLIEMESSVENASLELARIRASQNTAIELRQESAKFGYLTQKRNLELFRKSVISVYDMDKTKTETRIAKLQVLQEQDNQSIAILEYNRSKAVLQQRSIQSPFDGVVMERFKSVGEFVDDEPLMRIAQLDPLYVEVIVPVTSLGHISLGMKANVESNVIPNEKYVATVESIDRVADAASGTYGIRLILPNPDYQIPAGLRCQVSFLPEQGETPATVVEHAYPTFSSEEKNIEGNIYHALSSEGKVIGDDSPSAIRFEEKNIEDDGYSALNLEEKNIEDDSPSVISFEEKNIENDSYSALNLEEKNIEDYTYPIISSEGKSLEQDIFTSCLQSYDTRAEKSAKSAQGNLYHFIQCFG